MPIHSDLSSFIANYLVLPALFQVTTWERRSCSPLGDALACSVISWIHTLYTYYIICIRYTVTSMQFVNCDYVVLFCTFDIYCMSVRPGRGIPPLWLFLRFLPFLFFFPVKRFFFSICEVFPHSDRGSKDRGCRSLYRLQSPLRQSDCDFWLYE